jgi:predicted RNase H-like HicB family nuclease
MTVAMSDNASVSDFVFHESAPEEYVCRVWLHPESCGGFTAEVITLPGVASQGSTEEETIANLREAFKGAVESYSETGSAIPWCTEVPHDRPANAKEKWILMHG